MADRAPPATAPPLSEGCLVSAEIAALIAKRTAELSAAAGALFTVCMTHRARIAMLSLFQQALSSLSSTQLLRMLVLGVRRTNPKLLGWHVKDRQIVM